MPRNPHVILLARKPLEGTYVQNIQRWGCGALNIDRGRIAAPAIYKTRCDTVTGHKSNEDGAVYGEWKAGRNNSWSPRGRWPANLLLLHGPKCYVRGNKSVQFPINRWEEGAKPFGGGAGTPYVSENQSFEVEIWDCKCELKAPAHVESWHTYFKGFASTPSMWGYLHGIVDPPEAVSASRWEEVGEGENLLHRASLQLQGVPADLSKLRPSMRPGGWVLAQDLEDPWAVDLGAALVQEGFEVRDVFYVLTSQADSFYVPKAKTKEREKLSVQVSDDAPDWWEMTSTPSSIKENNHPTVKPKGVMRLVLRDLGVEEDAVVLDPFLGSGTTAIAGYEEGIAHIMGIEQSEEFALLAMRRVEAVVSPFWSNPTILLEEGTDLKQLRMLFTRMLKEDHDETNA